MSDSLGAAATPPEPPAVPPGSTAPPSRRPEFLQPKYVVGLSIAAVIVLIAGIFAFTAGGGDSGASDRGTSTNSATSTTRVLVTTPLPLPATTTSVPTTSSTTSTSTSSTSTLPPPAAVANAGADLAVDADRPVTLVALDLSEPNQSVVWRQLSGPGVTEGRRLLGPELTFVAPAEPSTLSFEVTVTGRGGDVATDEVRVDVFEQADRALFVDGVDGSGSGDGTREQPYRDLSAAIAQADARADGTDVYVRTVDAAYVVDATITHGLSIYGGYDGDWTRTPGSRPSVSGSLSMVGGGSYTISSLDLRGVDDSGRPVIAASSVGSLRIAHSVVRAGNDSGVSLGVVVDGARVFELIDSEVYGGAAGGGADGADAAEPDPVRSAGADGNPASGRTGGAALPGVPATQGGDGAEGPDVGSSGGGGAVGGQPGENGAPGAGGAGGVPGDGGIGGAGTAVGEFAGRAGGAGQPGGLGQPGGGGGGGGGLILHDGGGGGGGGAGGSGGIGGSGGDGGRGSAAVALHAIAEVDLRGSVLQGGAGGAGGRGGAPLAGTDGGDGRPGAPGVSTFLDTAGAGGAGGGGGAGGQGGWGGAGAGGPSAGLITSDVATITIVESTIRGGQGGVAGAGRAAANRGAPGAMGGVGGAGLGDFVGEPPTPASGGDSIGWLRLGDPVADVTGSTITGGTPGQGDGGGPSGQVIDIS